MLYFDCAATTAVFPELNELIARINTDAFYNPSALYAPALESHRLIDGAKSTFAEYLGVDKAEVHFTSCATESNNWFLRMACAAPRSKLLVTAGEHAAVRATADALRQKGVTVEEIPLTADGHIDENALFAALDETVTVVSMIHVSNETGAINDVIRLAKEIKEEYPHVLIHSDGVQALGKYRIAARYLDAYSVSAHKIHAPKGVGALYLKRNCRIAPLLTGGGQEDGLRSGTENVSGIAAFAAALKRYAADFDRETVASLRDAFFARMRGTEGFFVNGSSARSVSPHVVSCGIEGVRGETLMHAMEAQDVLIGMGSACSSHSAGNRVLQSCGVAQDRILQSVRISFDQYTTQADIERLAAVMSDCGTALKRKLK